ncbi:GAF domain-containing protein [Microbispora rosea]|uniref:GAF domain-containing protein n=1 Tax=Microbispora rosea TaxID=58117 RepID=A0A1N7B9S6_9ACTN|nr:GAF and ANTAR domain-containing protein [Microbispora rosea]SIR47993.1 GAF domain-containing protein [Microbispora rosea]
MAGRDERGGNGQGRPSAAYTGHAADDELAVRLSDLARTLQGEDTAQETLDAIVAAAVDTVPGAQHAGLTVVIRRREVETQAATGDIVGEVDRAQYETGEGPCLDATYRHRTVRLSDMTQEKRWPEFTRRAVDLGVKSMLSFQLYVQKDNLGALNLYSSEKNAFDDESEHVGLLFAAHAAVAMSGARQQEQLRNALAVRDLIGQAKGVLMERHKLTADQAFALLVRASQETNTKLADIAEYLVDTGVLRARGDR